MVVPANDVAGAKQGQWTYQTYATLPEDGRRYEIINGVLYMTPSPDEWHQTTVGLVFRYLATQIEDSGLGRVYIAPFDIELVPDVVVQPDVCVILNAHRERVTFTRIIGVPDLVVEVVSPGTVSYDRREKQDAYAHAGVTEYWLVDSAARTIEVLVLEESHYRSLGVFEGEGLLPSSIVPQITAQAHQFFSSW